MVSNKLGKFAMDSTEKAECGRLANYLNAVLPALEQFNSSDAADVAGPQYSKWRELLDRPLPESGQGLDSVLSELQEIVIPNGLRLGAPSFAGWITTAPTTAGMLASVAASVAGVQRYMVTPFNLLET